MRQPTTVLPWVELDKDHHKKYLGRIYNRRNGNKLKYLGIDEFSVQKGHKYLTIALDLEIDEIIFINAERSEETLIPLLKKLQTFGSSPKAVAVDMKPSYISSLQEYLPKVKIIFVRFHIVRMSQTMMDELRRGLKIL